MSTHNICFCPEIRQIWIFFGWQKKKGPYQELWNSWWNSKWCRPDWATALGVTRPESALFACTVWSEKLIIATDKVLFSSEKYWYLSYFSTKKICCGYSLEAPRRGASNEYPQHMFSWRNKKNNMWIPPLICSCDWYIWIRCSKISFIELSHPLQLRDFNRRMKGERTDVICPQKWTNTDRKPPYIIGKEVRATEKGMVKEWMWSVPWNDWLLGLG